LKISPAIFEAVAYMRHWFKAKGPHGVHSPFVFELITQILVRNGDFYFFKKASEHRNELIRNKTEIEVLDLGAGSKMHKSHKRKVSDIARHALQPALSAEALFRLVAHFKPENILEMGTSLGLTTAYLASANVKSKVISLEGAPEICKIAKQNWEKWNVANVQMIEGDFADTLESALTQMKIVDFALVDGNHRFQPTIDYVERIEQSCHEWSVIVLDDIHWSEEMEAAWDFLRKRPSVSLSLDFFHFGILFYRKGRVKEHFRLRLPDN
jgi:predicted O-methyltransferase YrrM